MAEKWPAALVRKTFVDFFEKKYGHTFVPSAPVVPLRDPTLLCNTAGMYQFKDVFVGTVDPNSDMGKLKRVVNSQCCIRAGGKHNDLDDVGKDTYHHTFFEMLGNWSFADYFKKEAIEWCWELITGVFALPKDRLYATYFGGDAKLGLEPDTEARDLWLQFLPADQVLPGSAQDNFWEMGDTGPCGPCSELHFDRIGGRNAASLVNQDDPMVLEVWNLVFMQYNRKEKNGPLAKLPSPHVDAGMGFERLVSIMQNKPSNYDTDLWLPLFAAIQAVTKHATSYTDEQTANATSDAVVAYRVVADHIRCITMALSDGATPDSVGRGFVLRRIIRRAIRYGTQFLGAETGFFAQLVPAVLASLGDFFPHLKEEKNVKRVTSIIKEEEESFAKTWKTGLKHFETAKQASIAAKSKSINPVDAFILHDRYGFPVDLTTLLAEKEGFAVDHDAFNAEMKKNQVSGGRVAAAKTFFDVNQVSELQGRDVPTTVDVAKYVWQKTSGKVVAIFVKDTCTFVDSLDAGEVTGAIGIVCDTTNFYFECGGQLYDTGVIKGNAGAFDVERVHSFGGFIVHVGKAANGALAVGETVEMDVDYVRRLPIAANHTATHQLNHSLRTVLQYAKEDSFVEVNQKGSYVSENSLRFDFSWNSKLTAAELKDVEDLLNKTISDDLVVDSQLVALDKAMGIKSLRCMFDEKYPDPCTVVSIGAKIDDLLADPQSDKWRDVSVELCGGTHIKAMGEVKHAVIVSEDSLMKGIRRMVIYTRDAATAAVDRAAVLRNEYIAVAASSQDPDDKQKAFSVLNKKVGDSDIPSLSKATLRDDCDKAIKVELANKKKLAAALKATGTALGSKWAAAHPEGAPFSVLAVEELGADREAVTAAMDAFSAALPAVGQFVIGVDAPKEKALTMVTLPKEFVTKGLSAVEWAKGACGKGGGKPNAAQTGVPVEKVAEAVALANDIAKTMADKL
jgi:alanyl-tRNA synthetase